MADIPLLLEPETPVDAEAIERLNERVFGPGRFARTAYRLREEAEPDLALSFVARVGTLLVGANRMTPIHIGETPAQNSRFWSATNPIMRAWASNARRPAASRCRDRSIPREFSIARSRPALSRG
jgi:hypothetical protein